MFNPKLAMNPYNGIYVGSEYFHLTKTEYPIMNALLNANGHIVSHEVLIKVSGTSSLRGLRMALDRIRRKLPLIIVGHVHKGYSLGLPDLPIVEPGVKVIRLTQGKFAMVDEANYEFLNQWNWCAVQKRTGLWYAVRSLGRGVVSMHKAIMDTPEGKQVDHIDRDGLNNRCKNLRVCTIAENGRNQGLQRRAKSSKYKGVYRDEDRGKWHAQTKVNQKAITLGRYDTEDEAAKAYNDAAIKFFGQFARINIIPDGGLRSYAHT